MIRNKDNSRPSSTHLHFLGSTSPLHSPLFYLLTSRSCPPQPTPLALLFSMSPKGMGYPFGQSGSAVLVLSPPSSSVAGQHRKLIRPWLCVSTNGVTNTVLILNPEDSTILVTRMKIHSIPAKNRILFFKNYYFHFSTISLADGLSSGYWWARFGASRGQLCLAQNSP